MRTCKFCGIETPEDAGFCKKCWMYMTAYEGYFLRKIEKELFLDALEPAILDLFPDLNIEEIQKFIKQESSWILEERNK